MCVFLNHVDDFALEFEIDRQCSGIYTMGSGKYYKLWLLVPPPPSYNPHSKRPVAKHLPGLHILRRVYVGLASQTGLRVFKHHALTTILSGSS